MEEEKIIKTTEEDFKGEEKESVSNIFRLHEMSDAIDFSLNNIQTVIEGHKKLIDTLDKYVPEEFKELKESFNSQIEEMNKQIEELKDRKNHLNFVLDNCKDNKEISKIIDELMLGLGIFKNM